MSSSSQRNGFDQRWLNTRDPLTRYAVHITGDIERARDVAQILFYDSARRSAPGWMVIWPSGFLPYVAIGPWMCGERKIV